MDDGTFKRVHDLTLGDVLYNDSIVIDTTTYRDRLYSIEAGTTTTVLHPDAQVLCKFSEMPRIQQGKTYATFDALYIDHLGHVKNKVVPLRHVALLNAIRRQATNVGFVSVQEMLHLFQRHEPVTVMRHERPSAAVVSIVPASHKRQSFTRVHCVDMAFNDHVLLVTDGGLVIR